MLRFLIWCSFLCSARALLVRTCQLDNGEDHSVALCNFEATVPDDLSNKTLHTAVANPGYETYQCFFHFSINTETCKRLSRYSAPLSSLSKKRLLDNLPVLISNSLQGVGNLTLPSFGCEPNCADSEIQFDNEAIKLYHNMALLELSEIANLTQTADNFSKLHYFRDRAQGRTLRDACEQLFGCERFSLDSGEMTSWTDALPISQITMSSTAESIQEFLQYNNSLTNFSVCGCMPVLRQTYAGPIHQQNADGILDLVVDLLRHNLNIRDRGNESSFHYGQRTYRGNQTRIFRWGIDTLTQSADSASQMAIQILGVMPNMKLPSWSPQFDAFPKVAIPNFLQNPSRRRLDECPEEDNVETTCDPARMLAIACFVGPNSYAQDWLNMKEKTVDPDPVAGLDNEKNGLFCTYANAVYNTLPRGYNERPWGDVGLDCWTCMGPSPTTPYQTFDTCFDIHSFFWKTCYTIGRITKSVNISVPISVPNATTVGQEVATFASTYQYSTAHAIANANDDAPSDGIFQSITKQLVQTANPEMLNDMQSVVNPFYKQSSDITSNVDELSPLLKYFLILGIIVFGFYLLVLLGKGVEFAQRKLKMGAELEGSRHEKVPVLGAATFPK